MGYDSTADTQDHIAAVYDNLRRISQLLMLHGLEHDASKLLPPEKEIFDKYTPLLRDTTYNSPEYEQHLAAMKTALRHHYFHNSHHPEHYVNGINGMSLIDVVEMFCDWLAATARHADGNIMDSIAANQKRFDMSDQLRTIFENTVEAMVGDE